jgi:hypothetical protein
MSNRTNCNVALLADYLAYAFSKRVARIAAISKQMKLVSGLRSEIDSEERYADCNRVLKSLKRQLNIEMTLLHEDARRVLSSRYLENVCTSKTFRKNFVRHLLVSKNVFVAGLNNMV